MGEVRGEQQFADVPERVLRHKNFEGLGLRYIKKDALLKHLPKGTKTWSNGTKYEWAVNNPQAPGQDGPEERKRRRDEGNNQ